MFSSGPFGEQHEFEGRVFLRTYADAQMCLRYAITLIDEVVR
jgi:hypothetical protein